jgi:hypothetical protein
VLVRRVSESTRRVPAESTRRVPAAARSDLTSASLGVRGPARDRDPAWHRPFDQLAADDPGGLRYAVFRLADGLTFVHVAIVEGETDPLPLLSAFSECQRRHRDRTVERPVPGGAIMRGAYGSPTP